MFRQVEAPSDEACGPDGPAGQPQPSGGICPRICRRPDATGAGHPGCKRTVSGDSVGIKCCERSVRCRRHQDRRRMTQWQRPSSRSPGKLRGDRQEVEQGELTLDGNPWYPWGGIRLARLCSKKLNKTDRKNRDPSQEGGRERRSSPSSPNRKEMTANLISLDAGTSSHRRPCK